MSNLFWGMQFRTCRIFWDFADHQSSLNPKKSYKYKSHTAITSIVVALATNLKIKCESLQKFLLLFAFAKSRIPLLSNFNLPNKADFTNPTQQTIEGIAVEVAERFCFATRWVPNFGRETRLGVCERPKFGKSMQDAHKRELQKEIAYDS